MIAQQKAPQDLSGKKSSTEPVKLGVWAAVIAATILTSCGRDKVGGLFRVGQPIVKDEKTGSELVLARCERREIRLNRQPFDEEKKAVLRSGSNEVVMEPGKSATISVGDKTFEVKVAFIEKDTAAYVDAVEQ